MYNLPYHKEKDEKVIEAFIEQYSFAHLSGVDSNYTPVTTQLPLLLENINGKKVLRGHFMKGTDHHKAFLQNENVLAVFSGKHIYVSGTWYSNQHSPSTWNYMSVHVKGKMRFVRENELIEILRKTSIHYENNNANSTVNFDHLSEKFKQKAIRLIEGFEIEIIEIDNVFKLSQDRDKESYLNIIRELKKKSQDACVIAVEMEKRFENLFPNEE